MADGRLIERHPPTELESTRTRTPISIRIFFEAQEQFVDHNAWRGLALDFFSDTSIADVFDTVRDLIVRNLRQHQALLNSLQHRKLMLLFWPEFKFDEARNRYVNLDDSGMTHIKDLGDLFPHLSEYRELCSMSVTITTKTAKTTSTEAADRVALKRQIQEFEYYRLGHVAEAEEKVDDSYGSGTPTNQRMIRRETAVVAWYGKESTSTMGLSKVPTWIIDDVAIGDRDYDDFWKKVPPKLEMDDKYGDTQPSMGEVKKFLQDDNNAAAKAELANGVPVLFTYSFNKKSLELTGVGVRTWPKGDVHLAFRFVNYLDEERFGLVAMPPDLQTSVSEEDTCQSLKKYVSNELRELDNAKLFNEKNKNAWMINFWVLPQRTGVQKMYRWRSHAPDGLMRFVSAEKVLAKEKRLYIEAHLVPVPVNPEMNT